VLKIKSIAMLVLATLTLVVGCAPQALAWPQERGPNGPRLRGPGPHRGEWLRQHQNQSPAEQEKALRSDPAFKQLPPERQQQLLDRLRSFNSLPPEQRQKILDNMDAFGHLPQAQQQQWRILYGQMQSLPQDRRVAVRQAARRLRGMDPAERERVLSSPQFQQRFSAEEQNLVRGLAQFEPAQR